MEGNIDNKTSERIRLPVTTTRQTSLLSLLQGLMKGVATYKRTFISDRTDTKYYVLA